MKRVAQRAIATSAATIALFAVASSADASAHHSRADARLTIVHGVRGLVANVRLDGKSVLTSFSPRRSAGPFTLSPGWHRIVVTATGSRTPLLSVRVHLTPGEQVTGALGLNSAGKPHLYAYPDTLKRAVASPATLVMRDVADASRLHAMVDGKDDGVIGDGRQLVHAVAVGKHTVSLVNPATGKMAVSPQRVPVTAGAVTALYLIGSAAKADLGWVATRIRPADASPSAVQTGNSGLAAPAGPPWRGLAMVLAGVVGVSASLFLRRRSRLVALN